MIRIEDDTCEAPMSLRETPHTLTYRFGGVVLARARIPAVLLDMPIRELGRSGWYPALWEHVDQRLSGITVIGQPVNSDLKRLSRVEGAVRYVYEHEERYWIDLSVNFDAYLKKFSSKTRNSFRRKLRKLRDSATEDVLCTEYRTTAEMPEFHRIARGIAVNTYQEQLGLALPNSDAFQMELLRLAQIDQVRGYVLFKDGAPIAFICCLGQGKNLVYKYLGYDARWSPFSPGTILTYLMIEKLHEEQRFETLDFGQQEFDYKKVFSTHHVRCANMIYLRPELRNCALVVAHHALHLAEANIVRALEYVGAKEKIKAIMHRRARR